jgi:hypothetical protein
LHVAGATAVVVAAVVGARVGGWWAHDGGSVSSGLGLFLFYENVFTER